MSWSQIGVGSDTVVFVQCNRLLSEKPFSEKPSMGLSATDWLASRRGTLSKNHGLSPSATREASACAPVTGEDGRMVGGPRGGDRRIHTVVVGKSRQS